MHRQPRATIDFESRSECDIERGSWAYSEHPTTQVLCLVYRLPTWAAGRTEVWYPDFPQFNLTAAEEPQELFDWILNGGLIEAHSSFFEYCMWRNQMVAKYGWPSIGDSQWRCSAAKAATHSLARSLEGAVQACGLPIGKDMEGSKVMKKMASPRRALKRDRLAWARQHAPCSTCSATGKVPKFKKNGAPAKGLGKCMSCDGTGVDANGTFPDMPTLWHESEEMLLRLIDYCRIDVLAEEGLSEHLPDLIPQEEEVFLVDQAMNARGFALDRDAVSAALRLIDGEFSEFNAELIALTDGAVEKATQRDRMKAWLRSEGLNLEDTTADTLDDVIEKAKSGYYAEDDVPWADRPTEKAIRGVELMRMLGRSSTAKYIKMADWMGQDGRVHGGLLYHGAGTGRWAGKGIQPHNFPKGTLPYFDMEEAWIILKRGTTEEISEVYRSVMEALSNALRGAIVPRPGYQLYVADFAAIECRVLLWAAGQLDALSVFYEGRCPYLDMASSIYGYQCWDASLDLDANKKKFKTERNMGKPAVLGLGYQMGASKFVESAAGYGIELVEDQDCTICGYPSKEHRKQDRDHRYVPANPDLITSVKIVNAYRSKMDKVVAMWNDQNDSAVRAVLNRGRKVPCGKVVWHWPATSDFLYCILPSGRALSYPFPEVKCKLTPWGSESWCMTFMGVDAYTKQWQRQTTYGGLLVENIIQAIARDLMAMAALRCERSGLYIPILTVHDELIAEAPIGKGDVKEFEHMMAEVPDWGDGCPVEAEGWRGPRYRK
jgi:DNA polymerase